MRNSSQSIATAETTQNRGENIMCVKNYIPIEKRSPKERRAIAASHRGSWHGINPCTRIMADRKVYRRKGRRVE